MLCLSPNRGDQGGHREGIDSFSETLDDVDDERLSDTAVSPSRRGDTWRQTTTYREMDMGFAQSRRRRRSASGMTRSIVRRRSDSPALHVPSGNALIS